MSPVFVDRHAQATTFGCHNFLARYTADPNILERIVTGDKTWEHYATPCYKKNLTVWKHKDEPASRKCKTEKFVNKLTCTVFWDHKCILRIDWMSMGTMINSAAHCSTLDLLRHQIREQRSELLRNSAILLHDKASVFFACDIRIFGNIQLDYLSPPAISARSGAVKPCIHQRATYTLNRSRAAHIYEVWHKSFQTTFCLQSVATLWRGRRVGRDATCF